MRILAVSHSCATQVNQELFNDLAKIPMTEVMLVMPRTWRNEYTGQLFTPSPRPDARFQVSQAAVFRPGHVWQHAYRQVPRDRIRAFDPDLVYSTQEPWSLANEQFRRVAKRLRRPFVFHTNQNLVKRLPPPFHQFEQAAYRDCALALAYSEEARRVMEVKGLQRASEVVPYGTNTRQFFAGTEPARRKAMGLSGSLVIGFLGRLVPEKGLDLLIRAGADLLRGGRDIQLLLIGDGSEREALELLAAQVGIAERVHFTGVIPHERAGETMRCLDILVLPSRSTPRWKEQFGRVLLEAWATHLPVVGSSSGEIPRLIHETGGGLVFRETDEAELARQLAVLIENPQIRRHIGERGAAMVSERYTFPAVASQLAGLFERTIREVPR